MSEKTAKCPSCGAESPEVQPGTFECFSCHAKFGTAGAAAAGAGGDPGASAVANRAVVGQERTYVCAGCRKTVREDRHMSFTCTSCAKVLCPDCFRPHETALGYPRSMDTCWPCYLHSSGVKKREHEKRAQPFRKVFGTVALVAVMVVIYFLLKKLGVMP